MKKIGLMTILIFFFVSNGCKKKTDNTIEILATIKNHLHFSGTNGLANIRFDIIKRNKKNGVEELLWTGVTDNQGKLSCKLTDFSNENIEYYYNYDRSEIEEYLNGSSNPCSCPLRKFISQPSDKTLKKNEMNEIVITYADFIPHKLIFVNTSCFDSNDRFRFRKRYMNIEEGWSEWSSNHYGCNVSNDFELTYNDSIIYEYEVERNGNMNVYQKTVYTSFYGSPDSLYY